MMRSLVGSTRRRWAPPAPPQRCPAPRPRVGGGRAFASARALLEPDEPARRRERARGRIHATSSGLFKLTLPLPPASEAANAATPRTSAAPQGGGGGGEGGGLGDPAEPAVHFLLHPRQPLSFLSALIASETAASSSPSSPPPDRAGSDPYPPPRHVTFHGTGKLSSERWSAATEVGDFVRDASRASAFSIRLAPGRSGPDGARPAPGDRWIQVQVPSFEERTCHLRQRLQRIGRDMEALMETKTLCDEEARVAAKRFAIGGFSGLAAYWVGVYYLTFHAYGWDLMEPVTYLVGLTTIMGGYLWFLYHQKEVSYRAAFDIQTSRRRQELYLQHGFDQTRWDDLVAEGTALRRAIKKIAVEYDVEWHAHEELAPRPAKPGAKPRRQPADVIRAHAEKDEAGSKQKDRKKEDGEEEDEEAEIGVESSSTKAKN